MRVMMKVTQSTALLLAMEVFSYYLEVADDYVAPYFKTRLDGGFEFTTTCGNRWDMVWANDQWLVIYDGSRAGWRSGYSALGANRVELNPGFARLAGKYLARIVAVESSGGDHGRDPWLDGWEVTQRCREDEELLAPAQPWEDAPWRTSFAKAA